MPINPNIALGVQQQQPVNYLGQMGQALALKAAAQDIQGNEALRDFYASGGNATTPEGARALMAANPKMGMQILKSQAETQKISGEALAKAYANNREALSMVRTPEDLLSYSLGQFNDPLVGPALKAKGLTPEAVAANLQREISTSGFENVLKKSAMRMEDWFKDQTSRRNTDVSAGVGYQRNALEREKWQYDIDNPKMTPLAGEKVDATGNKVPAYFGYDPRTNTMVEVRMPTVSVGPLTTVSTETPVNALAPQAAPQAPNVNALAAPAAGAPTSPVMRPPVAGTPSAAAPIAAIPSAGSPTSVSGGVRFGPKGTSDALTEYQGKSTAFAIRAKQAHDVLNAVGKDGKVQPGLIKRIAEATPFIGEGLGTSLNFTQSDAQQQVEQAQRNFVNAVLRQESGAAINEGEFNNAKKQYFPQPGDSPAVIEQKRLNREAAIQGFEVSAGPGAKKTTPPSAEPKKISSDAEYNSLPSGATFIAPDGTTRRKP